MNTDQAIGKNDTDDNGHGRIALSAFIRCYPCASVFQGFTARVTPYAATFLGGAENAPAPFICSIFPAS